MTLSRLTFPQLALAVLLGVAGGLYVYKPILQRYSLEQSQAREAAHRQGGQTAEGSPGRESQRAGNAPER
ncbi:protein PIGBOS1 [Heterodontus francisci]|uniref:protein PIGBOS1 n=1 Tax=Heterodontus francisci TaxID=7792 RepID=UPI00355B0350